MRKKVKLAVVESELKEYEVEQLAEMPRGKLSRIIYGACDPTPEEREALAEVLNKSVAEIFPRRIISTGPRAA